MKPLVAIQAVFLLPKYPDFWTKCPEVPGRKGVVNIPYVNVPNDLSKVKTKMAFNLTRRQLVCFGIAAAVGVPSYLLARGTLGNTGAMFLMLVVALPAFLLAM